MKSYADLGQEPQPGDVVITIGGTFARHTVIEVKDGFAWAEVLGYRVEMRLDMIAPYANYPYYRLMRPTTSKSSVLGDIQDTARRLNEYREDGYVLAFIDKEGNYILELRHG